MTTLRDEPYVKSFQKGNYVYDKALGQNQNHKPFQE